MKKNLDFNSSSDIMTPDELAQYLKVSQSWIYKYWKDLGGAKLGGKIFFPKKEIVYERIFKNEERKKECLEVRFCTEGKTNNKERLQNQKRSQRSGGRKEERTIKPERNGSGKGENRHHLLGNDQPANG